MEKTTAKIFLFLFIICAAAWLAAASVKNYHAGMLFDFGTVQFRNDLNVGTERSVYDRIAQSSAVAMILYPFVLLTAAGFLASTRRKFQQDGWLLMSAILLFGFIPVELYCYWLDWKLIGLNYWGNWPLEEFRKAVVLRMTALAGLPFIAQLCYYTIPIFVIFKPLQKKEQ
jgi:hypothetical protein